MEKQNIVIVGQQPWDTDIGSNCKNIAIELSKKNRVLYVNSPLDRITLLRNRNEPKTIKRLNVIKGRESGLVEVADNLWNLYPDRMVESINWIRYPVLFDLLNKRNNRLLADAIRAAIDMLGFGDFMLFNDNEMFKAFYLKELLNPKVSIYYSRDYMLGVDYWKRHGTRLEPMLIAKSDLCFSNSMYLRDYCRQYNGESYYVGQGCDLADADTIDGDTWRIDGMGDIQTPVIGYVGSLDSNRLAIDTIVHIAQYLPHYTVVLVGPEDNMFLSSELHQMPNVRFLGKKPVEELPLYINAFDVCINPQLVNEITIGNYPRKIDEYLAFGKPVVATRTRTMEIFEEVVYLTDRKEGYVDCIERALKEDDSSKRAARQALASTHTWENSVREMTTEIDRFLAGQLR